MVIDYWQVLANGTNLSNKLIFRSCHRCVSNFRCHGFPPVNAVVLRRGDFTIGSRHETWGDANVVSPDAALQFAFRVCFLRIFRLTSVWWLPKDCISPCMLENSNEKQNVNQLPKRIRRHCQFVAKTNVYSVLSLLCLEVWLLWSLWSSVSSAQLFSAVVTLQREKINVMFPSQSQLPAVMFPLFQCWFWTSVQHACIWQVSTTTHLCGSIAKSHPHFTSQKHMKWKISQRQTRDIFKNDKQILIFLCLNDATHGIYFSAIASLSRDNFQVPSTDG